MEKKPRTVRNKNQALAEKLLRQAEEREAANDQLAARLIDMAEQEREERAEERREEKERRERKEALRREEMEMQRELQQQMLMAFKALADKK